MREKIKGIFLLIFATLSFATHACRPSGLEYTIQFEKNSSSLNSETAEKLANWFLYARDDLQATEINIFSTSYKSKPESKKISEERMANIERLFQIMNSRGAPVNKNTNEALLVSDALDVVMIEIQPACAQNNTCCPLK